METQKHLIGPFLVPHMNTLKWTRTSEERRRGVTCGGGCGGVVQELEAYKQVFGDCLVPRKFWDNPALGEWCTLMRVKAREQSLSQQQIAALEAVEFPWKADGVGLPRPLPFFYLHQCEWQ